MRLSELLSRLPSSPSGTDLNLDALARRRAEGRAVTAVRWLATGLDETGPVLLVTFDGEPAGEVLPVGLGERARRELPELLGDVPVSNADDLSGPRAAAVTAEALSSLLGALLEETADLPAEERASHLMDWIMERIDASRCALVPMVAGTPGPPLALHVRGDPPLSGDPRRVPRAVIQHVARTRQALSVADAQGRHAPLAPEGTIAEQRVRTYLAVPIVFRAELLAVAYVDRLDRARAFDDEEARTFAAFAYELARPLLSLRAAREEQHYVALRDHLLERDRGRSLSPRSPALDEVVERARVLAPHVRENLLVVGETGVGKEWLARLVHEESHAAGRTGPFVALNVSAIPPELFESELMGSVRGAFTGAVDRVGAAQRAEGGTLFLDEIGDLELRRQVALLRFLQDKRVRPVGGDEERELDVRVIAATNRPLPPMVADGSFRADLLHRFAPPLRVPPLRERREEIPALAIEWLESRAREAGLAPPRLTRAAVELLRTHAWPGNVRQLRAVVGHALLLSDGDRIGPDDLRALLEVGGAGDDPPGFGSPDAGGLPVARGSWPELRESLEAIERGWLREGLCRHDGRVEPLAREMGLPASTLRHLLKRHDLK